MDLELKHLGQTLAVGGFAVFAVLYLLRVCRAKWVPRFFSYDENKLQLQHVAVYLALVFAAGILLEDVSKAYAARRASAFAFHLEKVINSDNELRLRSLFKVTELTESRVVVEPRAIFRELQSVKPNPVVAARFATLAEYVPMATNRIFVIPEQKSVAEFCAAVDAVFYDAKNRVYRQDNYFTELNDISGRMDFTRSLTVLCLIFSCVYVAFGLFGFFARIARFLDIDSQERFKLLILGLLYAAGIWLSATAYVNESNNYDLRVFGYYISLNTSPDK